MKKTLKNILVFVLALAMVLPFMPAAEASAKSTSIKTLREGKTYSLNLNGGSAKEKVRWTNSGTEASNTFNLYVNGRKVYSKHYPFGWVREVSCVDINTSDKYKEIAVYVCEENICYVDFFALRYINKNTVKKYSYSGEKLLRIWDVSPKVSKNKLFINADTPYHCDAFGLYKVLLPLKISGSKLKRVKENSYELDSSWVNSYGNTGWTSDFFTLAGTMKLYSKSSKKASYKTVYYGTRFKPLKIVPKNISSKSGYKYADLFVKVKTADGKTGWLYFPKTGSGYLKQKTGWG